jgi:hypothetical protein
MAETGKCQYCGRPIKGEPEIKILRGHKHTYCSDMCFKFHFYDVPTITYEGMQNMYKHFCVPRKLDYSAAK